MLSLLLVRVTTYWMYLCLYLLVDSDRQGLLCCHLLVVSKCYVCSRCFLIAGGSDRASARRLVQISSRQRTEFEFASWACCHFKAGCRSQPLANAHILTKTWPQDSLLVLIRVLSAIVTCSDALSPHLKRRSFNRPRLELACRVEHPKVLKPLQKERSPSWMRP